MRSRRVISLLMVVMICFSFSSCKDSGAVSSSNERGVSSKQRGVVETKEEIRKTDMMTAFCEYVEKNFTSNKLWVYTKDEDYTDEDNHFDKQRPNNNLYNDLSEKVLPTPYPNKIAFYLNSSSESAFSYEISVSEYESTSEAKTAFEAIISPDQSVIDTSDRNENSYYFNGKNEGFFCIGVQGNDLAMKLIGDKADQAEKAFGSNRSEFNYLAGVGIYLKNNSIVIVEIEDIILKDDPTHSETLDKFLKLFDVLGIKNPLSVGTDYDKVISYFDSRFDRTSLSSHINVMIVNKEIVNAMS